MFPIPADVARFSLIEEMFSFPEKQFCIAQSESFLNRYKNTLCFPDEICIMQWSSIETIIAPVALVFTVACERSSFNEADEF